MKGAGREVLVAHTAFLGSPIIQPKVAFPCWFKALNVILHGKLIKCFLPYQVCWQYTFALLPTVCSYQTAGFPRLNLISSAVGVHNNRQRAAVSQLRNELPGKENLDVNEESVQLNLGQRLVSSLSYTCANYSSWNKKVRFLTASHAWLKKNPQSSGFQIQGFVVKTTSSQGNFDFRALFRVLTEFLNCSSQRLVEGNAILNSLCVFGGVSLKF